MRAYTQSNGGVSLGRARGRGAIYGLGADERTLHDQEIIDSWLAKDGAKMLTPYPAMTAVGAGTLGAGLGALVGAFTSAGLGKGALIGGGVGTALGAIGGTFLAWPVYTVLKNTIDPQTEGNLLGDGNDFPAFAVVGGVFALVGVGLTVWGAYK